MEEIVPDGGRESPGSRVRSGNSHEVGDQPRQAGPKVGEGAAAVAELVLDERAQFAEGLVILGNQKQGIVAESLVAARFADDPAAAGAFGLEADLARGVGYRQAQRNAAPRRASGQAAMASRSLRLLAASSQGSPAYRAESTPARRSRRRPPIPSRRPGPERPVPGQARSPSCGRCRRTCSRSRRSQERQEMHRATGWSSPRARLFGSQEGWISSTISRHFLRLRDPSTRTNEPDDVVGLSMMCDRA